MAKRNAVEFLINIDNIGDVLTFCFTIYNKDTNKIYCFQS